MENVNNVVVMASLIGVLLGFVVGWLSRSGAAKKSTELGDSLQKSQAEMDSYRKDVTAHFEKTAQLVGEMTAQYRAVYDHLSDGAQTLCHDQTARLAAIGQGEALIASADTVESEDSVPSVSSPEPPISDEPDEQRPMAADTEQVTAEDVDKPKESGDQGDSAVNPKEETKP